MEDSNSESSGKFPKSSNAFVIVLLPYAGAMVNSSAFYSKGRDMSPNKDDSSKMERTKKKVEWSSSLSSIEPQTTPDYRSPTWDSDTGKAYVAFVSRKEKLNAFELTFYFIATTTIRSPFVLLFGRLRPTRNGHSPNSG